MGAAPLEWLLPEPSIYQYLRVVEQFVVLTHPTETVEPDEPWASPVLADTGTVT